MKCRPGSDARRGARSHERGLCAGSVGGARHAEEESTSKKKKNELQDAIGATLSCDDVFFDGQKHVACVCGGDVDVEERRERHREAWGRRLPSAVGWDMDV